MENWPIYLKNLTLDHMYIQNTKDSASCYMPSRWQKCEYPENLHTLDQEWPLPLEKAFIHSVSREEVAFSFKMWNALKFIGWSWIGNDWRIWWAVTIKLPIHCHHSISSWQTSTLPKHKSWNLVWVKTILSDIKLYFQI